MGVKQCDRRGCGNIMCRRVSQKYGYICDECFKELIFAQSIEAFMDKDASQTRPDPEFYEKIFPVC